VYIYTSIKVCLYVYKYKSMFICIRVLKVCLYVYKYKKYVYMYTSIKSMFISIQV